MTDILCMCEPGGFTPRPGLHARRFRETFGDGEIVVVSAEHERNMNSHRHQFAEIRALWETLPEHMADKPYAQSSDTLRKHALIATGHCNVEAHIAASAAEALRLAAFVGSLARKAHGYAIVETDGKVVRCLTPHSQSKAAMGGETFQQSKRDVLDWINALLARAAA